MPNPARVCFFLTAIALSVLQWDCSRFGRERTRSVDVAALSPLSQEDVNLYVDLMRAAALRVQNLLPRDTAALARMSRVQDDMDAGRIPTPLKGDPEAEVIARGMTVRQAMDEIIAEERGLDVAHYRTVRDQIERIVNPSNSFPNDGDEVLGGRITPEEARIRLANKKIVAPHADEIERLYQMVRRSLSEKGK